MKKAYAYLKLYCTHKIVMLFRKHLNTRFLLTVKKRQIILTIMKIWFLLRVLNLIRRRFVFIACFGLCFNILPYVLVLLYYHYSRYCHFSRWPNNWFIFDITDCICCISFVYTGGIELLYFYTKCYLEEQLYLVFGNYLSWLFSN